ncbi:MAG: phytochelatin synthase family protein [Oculatellaceae cyanobacterium bins.114]|nr:phytochelatin synthase family protein [Oculatellaceae cyanobacterium bins.114]
MKLQRIAPIALQRRLLTLVLLSAGLFGGKAVLQERGFANAQTLPLPPDLIAFNSPQGEELLIESEARDDFWNLSSQFVTQVNQAYCGVASMVMVLNSLGIPAPEVPQYAPYHVFTQENFFDNPATRQALSPDVVAQQGMTLDELGQLLSSYSVGVQVHHAADTTLEAFRQQVVENLDQPGNFVLVNYLRSAIGQERGGHISPIAAYNQESDRFLILDVARYKYPPVWVEAEDLWRAMATVDSTSGKTRGFVLVSRDR